MKSMLPWRVINQLNCFQFSLSVLCCVLSIQSSISCVLDVLYGDTSYIKSTHEYNI